MAFDFDAIIDRRNTNSEKWDVAEGELPMWVADMDFMTAPPIIEAVRARAASGVYGYTAVPPAFASSVAAWWTRRHGWEVDPAWVCFCIGIVPALSSLVRTFSEPGGNVLVQTPVYNCFFTSIANSGRRVVSSDLIYRDGVYQTDWTDLEAKLADPATSLFLLCNPQNPTGNLWTAQELARIGDLAARHDVVVIADEIHCDLTAPGIGYTPYASASQACAQNSIVLVSPTKAFNIPGLKASAMIVADPDLRATAQAGLNRDEINEPNAFAAEAAVAAFTKGEPWLDALRAYVFANRQRLTDFVTARLPALRVVPSQATYLVWVDCTGLTADTAGLCEDIRRSTGLFINPGNLYGNNGKGFVRINIACPTSLLDDGLDRLRRGIEIWARHAHWQGR